MTRCVRVHAPSRLHFGMFGFGRTGRPQFGGVGVMIEPPTIQVEISPATAFGTSGSHADRLATFVESIAIHWHLNVLPPCRVHAVAPLDHIGLGVGTQLGLSVAVGLRHFLKLPELPIEQLASSARRGARSAVGTYGFERGGLILDGGKQNESSLGVVVRSVKMPEQWRIVLVRPVEAAHGLAGDRETAAFAQLPAVPQEVTDELWNIANDDMLRAVAESDCDKFGDAVYRFGCMAGECFATVQGGPFATREVAAIVEAIRNYGVAGAGQSSWGPTVFAIVANQHEAETLVDWLRLLPLTALAEISIAHFNNKGAHVSAS